MSDPIKPGYKTTEFWQSSAVSVIGLLAGSGLIHVPDMVVPAINAAGAAAQVAISTPGSWFTRIAGFLMAGLASWGYSQSRGNVKQSQAAPAPVNPVIATTASVD